MGKLVLYIVLIVLLPVSFLILFLDKRAKKVIFAFDLGICVCLCSYFANTFIFSYFEVDSNYYSVVIAPMVEEFLKFIPLVLLCAVFKQKKRASIAMSFALGVGFCVCENTFYLFNYFDQVNVIWIIARCLGTGLMHSLSATLMGFGLFKARTHIKITTVLGVSSLFFAIMYHGLFNLLVSIEKFQIFGILLTIVSYISVLLVLNFKEIKNYLKEDDEETAK